MGKSGSEGGCRKPAAKGRQGAFALPYDLLSSREVENIFENSDFVLMMNQAGGDRQVLAKQLNISPHQLSYVTHSGEGEGLLFYGNVIVPLPSRRKWSMSLHPTDRKHNNTNYELDSSTWRLFPVGNCVSLS